MQVQKQPCPETSHKNTTNEQTITTTKNKNTNKQQQNKAKTSKQTDATNLKKIINNKK